MKALKFVVRYPDGRSEEFLVDSERVLIGSGAHCDIRLPLDQAQMEHVAVNMGAASAFAEALAFQPPPTLNGSPFTQATIMANSVLGVGHVQLFVSVEELASAAGVIQAKKEKTSPMTYVLAAIAVPISLYLIFSAQGRNDTPPAPDKIPALWDEPVKTCPQNSAEQALVLAQDKLVLANARRERRPFHVQDGVAAVPLYEQASACFRTAGKTDNAQYADQTARKLREGVAEDFRTHRVRLEHAMTVKDFKTAQIETRVLLAFLEGKQGDYVTWLSNLDRKLQLKYGSTGRKKK